MTDIIEELRSWNGSLSTVGLEATAEIVGRAADHIERLREWLEGDALCPCCEQTRECTDGCTFHADDVHSHERMQAVRDLLKG